MKQKFKTFLFLASFALGLAMTFAPTQAQDKTPSTATPIGKVVHHLKVSGPIGPATSDYISRQLKKAGAAGAQAAVIEMHTPGGLLSSTQDIVQDILGSPVPVITYVSPPGSHAASAGTFIMYASHIAAMAPGTNLGAATPIQMGSGGPASPDKGKDGEQTNKDALDMKALNDSAAYIRGLAEMRGRNAEWAEEAVRKASSITSTEALEKNVIDVIAKDMSHLLQVIDGKQVTVNDKIVTLNTKDASLVNVEPDWRTELLSIITDPNVAFLLMTIGAYGLIYEFSNPGAFVPGVIGVICLTIGLYALNVLPVNYAGMVLLFLGMAFMVAEVFIPSGILGTGGVIAFAIGATILIDTDVPGFQLSPWTIIMVTGMSALVLIFILSYVMRAFKRPITTGEEQMLGSLADVVKWSGGTGEVRIQGELWQAEPVYEGEKFKPGENVVIESIKGLKLFVTSPSEEDDEAETDE